MKKIMLFSAVFISFAGVTVAQKTPADSNTCRKNFSISSEYFRQQNFSAAMESWRFAFNNCPSYSRQIYEQGEVMFEKFITNEKKQDAESHYLDTLLLIYDQEIKYFKEEGRILGKKGISLNEFAPERKNEIRNILERSVKLEAARSTSIVLQTYFGIIADLYKEKKLNQEATCDIYVQVSELIDINMAGKNSKVYEDAGIVVDSLFNKAISCDDLEKIYTPLFEANVENVTLLKKIVFLLGKKQCYHSPLFLQSSQKLYRTEPSGQSALNLAHMYAATGENTKAAGYFNDAFELESNTHKKSAILLESATFQWMKLKNYAQARTLMQRAASLRPDWGKPWMMLGDLFAAGASSCNDSYKGASVFWVSTDKYLKAKTVDPNSAAEADQKILINSKQYPNQKDILAKGMKVGDSYTVKCWINENTTIRSK